MKFGNLVVICLWLHLAVKGLEQEKREAPRLSTRKSAVLRDRSFFMREGGLVGFGGGHWKKIGLKGGASRKKMKERGGGSDEKLD